MEAICSSETSVDFERPTRRYNLEDMTGICSFVLIRYNNIKYKLTYSDFTNANLSLKPLGSIFVLWKHWGDCSVLSKMRL
jgi:hypothetical protein